MHTIHTTTTNNQSKQEEPQRTSLMVAPTKFYIWCKSKFNMALILSIGFLLVQGVNGQNSFRLNTLGSDGPGGVCVRNGNQWDCYGQHISVPEPTNPGVLLAAAGVAVMMKRKRH